MEGAGVIEETVRGTVEMVDPTILPAWDMSLASNTGATVFHSAAWAALLKNTYGQRPLYLVLNEGSDRGIWPIMEIDSPLTGRRGISLPFTDYCHPLVSSARVARHLFRHACDIGRSRGWRYFELRGGRNFLEDTKPFLSFNAHVIPLHNDPSEMLKRCDPAVRRALRKAAELEVCGEISYTEEAVRTFYKLHCLTRQKHGLPPQPFSFFENIHRHIISDQKGFVSLAVHEGRPVAAGIFFHFGDNALYKFGASDHKLQQLRGNNVMMWKGMHRCAALGCKSLHLGRTSLANTGLQRFKLGWGAEESLLEYARFDLETGAFVSGNDKAFGWHNHVFRALPMPVSRLLGSLLYRHMG